MSRYKVGKLHPFVRHTFSKKNSTDNEDQSYNDIYLRADKPIKTEIVFLKCISEHNVPIEYTDNKFANGYLFENEKGVIFKNQYPTAEYGQTSNIGDFIVRGLDESLDEKNKLIKYMYLGTALNSLSRGIAKGFAPDFAAEIKDKFDNFIAEHDIGKIERYKDIDMGYDIYSLVAISAEFGEFVD